MERRGRGAGRAWKAEEWRKEEEMEGQMDGCCNGEWGGERGRLVGMGFCEQTHASLKLFQDAQMLSLSL